MIILDDPGYETIRTTLQSAMRVPFSVTTTSSRIGDGKTQIAAGTACTFAQAGFKTLLVDANPYAPMVSETLGITGVSVLHVLEDDPFPTPIVAQDLPDTISIASFRLLDETTLGELRRFIAAARERYDVVVFDTSDFNGSPFVAACCAATDGVVLAVRYGRRRHLEDRRLIAAIEGAGGTVIGSVPTRFPRR